MRSGAGIATETARTRADHAAERPGEVRLRLEGPLTASNARQVRSLIANVATAGGGRLLVDLHDVTALDAAGIAALLMGQRQVEREPEGMMVLRANGLVTRALKRSGTIGAFRVREG